MQNLEEEVLRLIKSREDKLSAISGSQIAEILKLDGSVATRKIIHYLRTELGHIQILANGKGYFWSDDPKDWLDYADKLHKRWVQICEVESAIRQGSKKVRQESLFEEVGR